MRKKVARSITERRLVPQGRQGHAPSRPQSHLVPNAGRQFVLERCKGHKSTPALLASSFPGQGQRADDAGVNFSGAGSPPSRVDAYPSPHSVLEAGGCSQSCGDENTPLLPASSWLCPLLSKPHGCRLRKPKQFLSKPL